MFSDIFSKMNESKINIYSKQLEISSFNRKLLKELPPKSYNIILYSGFEQIEMPNPRVEPSFWPIPVFGYRVSQFCEY